MEIEIVLIAMASALISAYLLHHFHKKSNMVIHLGDKVFSYILIVSILLFPVSILLVGGWDGLYLAAIGVYLFFPSLSGLILTKLLKKFST